MFASLLRCILDIFVDERDNITPRSEVKDLTVHYRLEIPHLFLDRISVASEYSETKELLESYKYLSQRENVKKISTFYQEIYRQTRSIYGEESWVIIPVPMHWSRYSIRWFDHMGLIAREMSKLTGYPTRSLLSTRYRPRQTSLSRRVRLANKTNAFKIRGGIDTIPENIILIDDVISSGSTANACAQVLKESGAKNIVGWFLASNN